MSCRHGRFIHKRLATDRLRTSVDSEYFNEAKRPHPITPTAAATRTVFYPFSLRINVESDRFNGPMAFVETSLMVSGDGHACPRLLSFGGDDALRRRSFFKAGVLGGKCPAFVSQILEFSR